MKIVHDPTLFTRIGLGVLDHLTRHHGPPRQPDGGAGAPAMSGRVVLVSSAWSWLCAGPPGQARAISPLPWPMPGWAAYAILTWSAKAVYWLVVMAPSLMLLKSNTLTNYLNLLIGP